MYKHSLTEYATIFRVNKGTIAVWKKANYPLDDHPAMYELYKSGKIKSNLSHISTDPVNTDKPKNKKHTIVPENATTLERLRISERTIYNKYQDALDEDDSISARKYLESWNKIIDQLRKTELTDPQISEINKNTLSVDEVREVLTRLFYNLKSNLEAQGKRLSIELVNKSETEIILKINEANERLMQNLFDCSLLKTENEDE